MTMTTCDSLAAIVVHARELGPKGHCYSGGADTRALCGADVSWDCQLPSLSCVTCRTCKEKLNAR